MSESVDIVVIGTGPGGEDAAGRLAEAGLSVVAVESRLVGGECPYYACVPTKMMARASDLLAESRRTSGRAGTTTVAPDWTPVAERIATDATDHWNDQVAVDRLQDKGVRVVKGRGRITARGEVTVDDQTFRATRGILLNTGTSPTAPPIDGLADLPYWTNRDIVQVTEAPASLLVLGGGVVGAELAQIFARFGTEVTIVEVADRLLAQDEPETSDLIERVFTDQGITVRTGAKVSAASHDGSSFTLSLPDGDLTAERLLVAAGRRPNIRDLGLDHYGVDDTARALPVDDRLRVTDGLWAIGDITGKGAFTHMSMYQAAIATRSILGEDGPWASYHAVPRVTFTDPEIGAVGLTEAQARDQGLNIRTGTTRIPDSSRGWIHGSPGNEGYIKLIEDADRGILVGATTAGPYGGEILGLLLTAVHARVPTATLKTMIYAYPTFHRAIESALTDLG
ncbi:dihydrolipoyl dehydrogenase family protein [Actinomadura rupiterrae]|uniref:dihydrolipoyl dehydrogenase family protein n=1 Tax=Actinomadura rupiterrae TaxID=559627 RepID=UPI0020A26CDA|nr:NAD(P)/FAD-dependent oxidoreductase [Actinomadura rupiterrae]MCP2336748.1 pyruvate/2-oxoglutarate dehydrogenase complex dihydrolipoamide dehydrogenase (E3) component [Actinomadura rupiterrae]